VRPALVYYGLLASLVIMVLVAFEPLFGGSKAAAGVRVFLGAVLLAEACMIMLVRGRQQRRELLEGVLARVGRHRLWRFVLGPTLLVVGVIFAGFGGLEVARGLRGLF
jgi:hypothetical protein